MQTAVRKNTTQLNPNILKKALEFWGRKPAAEHLALLMPENPRDRADLVHSNGKTSVFAHVRKGNGREKCQDVVITSMDKGHSLIGVLDGFGPEGDFIPDLVGIGISLSWSKNKHLIRCAEDLKNLVFGSVVFSLRNIWHPDMRGGTTATIAAVLPDQRFFVAGVGDSACYLIDPEGKVRRLLAHDRILRRIGNSGYIDDISNHNPRPDDYVYERNMLAFSISKYFSKEHIETEEGVLETGAKLLLVSDGITKNLYVGINGNGGIDDVSGCSDLEGIISGKQEAASIGEAIVSRARERADAMIRRTITIGESKGIILLPADDDMSVVVLERN